ncbi:hypothetical protein OIV83_003501 [Microbotryomycetes sp. JL201]|nr:hypothetical protein OIV83_003501 [Microbotryomycetes sp. JL201]
MPRSAPRGTWPREDTQPSQPTLYDDNDKRLHGRTATDTVSRLRAATFVVAGSSLLLAAGLALLLYATLHTHTATDDDEYSEAGGLARTAAQLALKWASCSALASLSGTIGVLLMVRLFAVGAAIDLVCTVLLLSVLILLVCVPTLAEPFSHLLCHAVTSGEFSSISPFLWNRMDVCEQHWRWAMAAIILGAVIAIALRAWGTAITWQHYNAMSNHSAVSRRGREGQDVDNDEWFDTEMMRKEEQDLIERRRRQHRRDVEQRTNRRTDRDRSSTLPILMGAQERHLPAYHGRFKSHSFSHPQPLEGPNDRRRPQLVLVPVFMDERPNGHSSSSSSTGLSPTSLSSPSFPPSFIPAFATPPRRHRPSTSSASSTKSRESSSSRSGPSLQASASSAVIPAATTTSCRHSTTSTSPRLPFIQPASPTFCLEPEKYCAIEINSFDSDPSASSRPRLQRGRSKSDNGIRVTRGDSGYASLHATVNSRKRSPSRERPDNLTGNDADDESDESLSYPSST